MTNSIYELETYVMLGETDIDCLIQFEFIEGDVEFEMDSIDIISIIPLEVIQYISTEWLPEAEIERLEQVCMNHYRVVMPEGIY